MLKLHNLILTTILILCFSLNPAFAAEGDGTLDQAASPTGAGPAGKMYSLRGMYDRLYSGTTAVKGSGFTEPTAAPADGVMYTLNNILDGFNTDATACSGTLAANVLAGKTFFATSGTTRGTNWGPVAGTMTDRTGTDVASIAQVAAGGINYFTAAAGYYDGTARVSATNVLVAALAPALTTGNIVSGITIFGVTGTFLPTAGIPKTGQTTSYLNYDDGYYKKGTPASGAKYATPVSNTVLDNGTGLTWVQDPFAIGTVGGYDWSSGGANVGKFSLANALLAVTALNAGAGYGGYTDWRVPNIKELQSIVNYGNVSPAIGETTGGGAAPFTNTQSYHYWSSTTYAASTGYAWNVDFYDGLVKYDGKTNAYYVRPVRGG